MQGTGTNVMNTDLDRQCLLTKICIPTTGHISLAIYSKVGKVTIKWIIMIGVIGITPIVIFSPVIQF